MFQTILTLGGLGLIVVGKALHVQEVRRFERSYDKNLKSFDKELASTAMGLHYAVSMGCYSVQMLGLLLVIFGIFNLEVLISL